MKRLFSLALLSSTFLLDINLIKADTFYGVHDRHHGTFRYLDILSFNTSTNVKTKLESNPNVNSNQICLKSLTCKGT